MLRVRLLTLVIAVSLSSQAHAMFFRLSRSVGMRTGRESTKRFCSKPPLNKTSSLGKKILVAGTAAATTAAVITLLDIQEKQNVMVEFANFYLIEKKDLPALIEHAVSLGINPNDLVTKYGTTPLMHACGKRDTESLKKLIEYGGFDINQQDWTGQTALMHACASLHLDTVQLLCTCDGIDFDVQDSYGLTALIQVIRDSNNPELVQFLITQPNIDVNKECNEVFTVRIQEREGHVPDDVTAIYRDGTGRALRAWSWNRGQNGQKVTCYVSALSEAINYNRPNIIQILLDHPDIDTTTESVAKAHIYSFDTHTGSMVTEFREKDKQQAEIKKEQKILKRLQELSLKE